MSILNFKQCVIILRVIIYIYIYIYLYIFIFIYNIYIYLYLYMKRNTHFIIVIYTLMKSMQKDKPQERYPLLIQ